MVGLINALLMEKIIHGNVEYFTFFEVLTK